MRLETKELRYVLDSGAIVDVLVNLVCSRVSFEIYIPPKNLPGQELHAGTTYRKTREEATVKEIREWLQLMGRATLEEGQAISQH
jgi:hypothetical protein